MAYTIGTYCKYVSYAGTGPCLKVSGDNEIKNNQSVTVNTDSRTASQTWKITSVTSGLKILSSINQIYGLNIYLTTSNCDVYPVSGNDDDSLVAFEAVDATKNIYRIRLSSSTHSNKYLTATGSTSGSNVKWDAYTSTGTSQQWKIIETGYPYGESLTDKTGLTEFTARDSSDLLGRLIYSEAEGESNQGKRGVAFVAANRKAKNLTEFGGNTYEGVILKTAQFAGMGGNKARSPALTTAAWIDSIDIATDMASQTNPIGSCLWFLTNSYYNSTVTITNGVEYYNFGAGAKQVIEKIVIGGHTFFRVQGY